MASDPAQRNVARAFRNGSPSWRFALDGNVRNHAISPNGAFILATDRNTAHLLSPESGSPIWSFSLPDDALAINSAASPMVAWSAWVQHSSLNEGLALILDRTGRALFERRLFYGLSNAWIPRVQSDAAGALMLIRTREQLLPVAIR